MMFDIEDSVGFYRLMIENYDDFVENSGSSRHAVNCAISTYHMAEWIWGDWLQTDFSTWTKLRGVRDRDSFKSWIDQQTTNFGVVQDIANGSKHFAIQRRGTKSTGTYVDNDYVESDYQEQYLEVEVDGRWVKAIVVVEAMVMFWESFLKEHRPQAMLPRPRNLSLIRMIKTRSTPSSDADIRSKSFSPSPTTNSDACGQHANHQGWHRPSMRTRAMKFTAPPNVVQCAPVNNTKLSHPIMLPRDGSRFPI